MRVTLGRCPIGQVSDCRWRRAHCGCALLARLGTEVIALAYCSFLKHIPTFVVFRCGISDMVRVDRAGLLRGLQLRQQLR
jgi:hypothetical protein